MNRRRLLGALAGGAAAALAGCSDYFATGGGDSSIPESDRPAVDETFAAGPMEARCDRGEPTFPPMSKRTKVVEGRPEERTAAGVESFVRAALGLERPVILQQERPERIGWRGRTFEIEKRYSTERYFVGWIGQKGGNTTVLALLYEDRARIVVYNTANNC